LNIKSEDLQSHLARLRGDVKIDTFISIDNVVLKANEPFNVYLLAEEFSRQLLTDGRRLDKLGPMDLSYISWLQILGLVKNVTMLPSYVGSVPNYLVTPVAPTARDIVKTILIVANAVGDECLEHITERDIYVYNVFKDIVRAIPYDAHLDPLGNVKKLSKAGEEILEEVLTCWKSPEVATDIRERLCFNSIPVSRVTAFKSLF